MWSNSAPFSAQFWILHPFTIPRTLIPECMVIFRHRYFWSLSKLPKSVQLVDRMCSGRSIQIILLLLVSSDMSMHKVYIFVAQFYKCYCSGVRYMITVIILIHAHTNKFCLSTFHYLECYGNRFVVNINYFYVTRLLIGRSSAQSLPHP